MTLRLDEDMARDLEVVARVRGTTVSHAIRLAVARYLQGLGSDEEFQARISAALEDEGRVLQRLVSPGQSGS